MEKNCEIKPRPKSIEEFFTSWVFWRPFLAITLGGIAGFLYYFFEGRTIEHSMVSNPYMSILWGALFGLFFILSPCSRGRC
jgi:hypothetical protein